MNDEEKIHFCFRGDYLGNELHRFYFLLSNKPVYIRHLDEKYRQEKGQDIDYYSLPQELKSKVRTVNELADCITEELNSPRGVEEKVNNCKPYVKQMAEVMGLEPERYCSFLDNILCHYRNGKYIKTDSS